jgi:hypothetical protein
MNVRTKHLKLRILVVQVASFPFFWAFGLGMYGLYAAQGNAFWAPLNSSDFCKIMIGTGGVVSVASLVYVGVLVYQLRRHERREST